MKGLKGNACEICFPIQISLNQEQCDWQLKILDHSTTSEMLECAKLNIFKQGFSVIH